MNERRMSHWPKKGHGVISGWNTNTGMCTPQFEEILHSDTMLCCIPNWSRSSVTDSTDRNMLWLISTSSRVHVTLQDRWEKNSPKPINVEIAMYNVKPHSGLHEQLQTTLWLNWMFHFWWLHAEICCENILVSDYPIKTRHWLSTWLCLNNFD